MGEPIKIQESLQLQCVGGSTFVRIPAYIIKNNGLDRDGIFKITIQQIDNPQKK